MTHILNPNYVNAPMLFNSCEWKWNKCNENPTHTLLIVCIPNTTVVIWLIQLQYINTNIYNSRRCPWEIWEKFSSTISTYQKDSVELQYTTPLQLGCGRGMALSGVKHQPRFFFKYDVTNVLLDKTRHMCNPSIILFGSYCSLSGYPSVRFH